MAGNLGNLPELATQYLHAAVGTVRYFATPPLGAGAIYIAGAAGVLLFLILLRVYIGGILGFLLRYAAHLGIYWKIVHYQPFATLFPPSEALDPHMGLIPLSAKLILAINAGKYGGWIVAAYLVVALYVVSTFIGWIFRRRRLARRGAGREERSMAGGEASDQAAGGGQAFDVVRREGEKKQTMVIMMTDIKGYSARMEKDEAATFELLKEHNVIMRRAITSNRGKEIKTIGDAFMVVFNHPIDAVRCGMAMQKGLYEFNKPRAANDHLLVRIGIHQGEVIVTGKDVFGEGVNIAARMESITDPGGISISKDIMEAIKGKVEAGFQSVGIPKMKNIANPPEVFKIHLSHS